MDQAQDGHVIKPLQPRSISHHCCRFFCWLSASGSLVVMMMGEKAAKLPLSECHAGLPGLLHQQAPDPLLVAAFPLPLMVVG